MRARKPATGGAGFRGRAACAAGRYNRCTCGTVTRGGESGAPQLLPAAHPHRGSHWTKRIAGEQARLARAGTKTSRALRRLYQTRTRRLKHAFIALAAEIARILKRHRVTVLFLEDLTGICEDMDFGPGNPLVHNFWAFRLLRKLVAATCARAGIAAIPIPPKGTSSSCAACGTPVSRAKRHRAFCPACGRAWHADANAAALMLRLWGSSKGHGAEATPQRPSALRWDRHRWVGHLESAAGMPARAASSSLMKAA